MPLFFLCFLAGFFGFAEKIFADSPNHVIINEIQIAGKSANDEFIELYNPTNQNINISTWSIQYRGYNGTKYYRKNFTKNSLIKANGYFLIAHNSFDDANVLADMSHSTFALSAEYGGTVFLTKIQKDLNEVNPDSVVIDKVGYGLSSEYETLPTHKPKANQSIERINFKDTDNNSADFIVLELPNPQNSSYQKNSENTPGKIEETTTQTIYSTEITLNEILPAPSKDKEEFIELYNPSEKDVDLSDWILRDGSKTGEYVFPKNTAIKSQDYSIVYKKDFGFALNNSGSETVTLFDPAEKIISSVSYENSKEDISYNFDGKDWHWSKSLTPAAENIFNNLPESKNKVPKKVFVNTYADFSAKGADADNDSLKYAWDFGDGHKSYLRKTRHKYEKSGKYTVILKVSDGSEDKIENFKVEVKKFPKLNVKIIELSPNPKGKDADAEFITLKNNSKKKINLKDWSIAAGNKKLYNHPITDDLIIKPNQEIQITHINSKFALNNKSAKIELRYPTGKTASKVAYSTPEKPIPEGAIYAKNQLGWTWKIPALQKELSSFLASEKTIPVEQTQIASVNTLPENIPQKPKLDPEIEKNLGKFSQSASAQEKKKTKFSLLNFGLRIKTAQAFSEEKTPPTKNYFFTQSTPPQKHWTKKLLESLTAKINLFLNKLFILF